MGALNLLSIAAAAGNAARQALQSFATGSGQDTPRSLGQTACDTDGLALMGRAMHDTTDAVEATATAADALPAYTKRARLILQNTDADGATLWFDFGTDAVAGACFQCLPGQLIVLDGDACPPDRLSVVADSGETARMFAKDW